MHRPQHRTQGFGIMLLLMQMLNFGLDRIPPVTLALIAGQAILHLRYISEIGHFLSFVPYSVSDICISALHVWYRAQWQRLILAVFYHLDDMHLYFNMTSLMWKGFKLERHIGSARFGVLIAIFSVLSSATLVLLSVIAEHLTGEGSYLTTCAAGFSGWLCVLAPENII